MTTAQSCPLIATMVRPPWLIALNAYSGKINRTGENDASLQTFVKVRDQQHVMMKAIHHIDGLRP